MDVNLPKLLSTSAIKVQDDEYPVATPVSTTFLGLSFLTHE